MKNQLKLLTVLVGTALMTACGSSGSSSTPINIPAIDSAYQGVWTSSAYGDVLVVNKNDVEYYKYSSDYCVLQQTFDGLSTEELTRSLDFIENNSELTWYSGYGTREFSAPTRQLIKVSDIPASCQDNLLTMASSLSNQELFALYSQVMSEYYVDFSRNNVDWASLSFDQQSNITEQTVTLYEAIYQTLLPLADGHNSFTAADGTQITVPTKRSHIEVLIEEYALANGLSYPLQESELTSQIVAAIEAYIDNALEIEALAISSYATTDIEQDETEQIIWFTIDDIGYLRIDSMTDYSTVSDDEDDLAQTTSAIENINNTLDQALTDLADTSGLIIDIRQNGGGNDYISLAIASRFAESEFLAYKKFARDGSNVTETKESYVSPSEFVQYTNKPLAILVSNFTASAAEVFSLAMAQLDNATFIGEPTQGIFSDILEWALPGGHQLGLSNEVYLSPDDIWYEGTGLPVDIEVPFFAPEDRNNIIDSGIETALEALQ